MATIKKVSDEDEVESEPKRRRRPTVVGAKDEEETVTAHDLTAEVEEATVVSSAQPSIEGSDERFIGEVPSPSMTEPTIHGVPAKKRDPMTLLRFTMFADVDPAPRVGHVDLVEGYGIKSLQKGKIYRLPEVVCEVLLDRKLGSVLPD